MQPGARVADRFVIERRAGAGGMGTVFRAHDIVSGGSVALKLLLRRDEGQLRRLNVEARALAESRHPGIVRYVAHGATTDGVLYLATEWLSGEDLAIRLRHEALSVHETLVLGERVALALSAAHARGVLHRDIKPSNVFLVEGDPAQAKVLDFGIAADRQYETLRRKRVG